MNVSQVSLRDIEYIVAVSDELHFGRAAIKLGVSQPTLSEQIQKIEKKLDIKFFERSKRSVHITPEGLELLIIARRILTEAQSFIDVAKRRKGPLEGEFNLGAIATVGPYYFPFVISALKKAFPKLELIVHEGQTDILLKKLDQGELDAVIASRTFDEKPYRVYSLYEERFWLAAPKNQTIKTKNGKVSVKDVDKDNLILLTDGNCLKDEILNFCGLNKNTYKKTQGASLETLRCLVASGIGQSFFPELALTEDKKLRGLVAYYPFQEKSAKREIVLVAREQFHRPNDIRLLCQELKEQSAKLSINDYLHYKN